MPLFLTRKDREIIAEQERLDEIARRETSIAEAQREYRGARERQNAAIKRRVEEQMRHKEEEWPRIKPEINPPLRDIPPIRPPFKSNDESICGAGRGYCNCGHKCGIKKPKCDHLYNFGEITCVLCGEKLGA